MKTLLLFLALTGFAGITDAVEQNKKVYTWTDNQGVIHYSDRPVQGKDSEVLSQNDNNNIATLAPKESQWQQDYQKNKQDTAKEQKLLDDNSKQKQEYCQRIQKRLVIFENGGRIYNASKNGERSFYSDDDIAKEVKQLKSKLKKSCL